MRLNCAAYAKVLLQTKFSIWFSNSIEINAFSTNFWGIFFNKIITKSSERLKFTSYNFSPFKSFLRNLSIYMYFNVSTSKVLLYLDTSDFSEHEPLSQFLSRVVFLLHCFYSQSLLPIFRVHISIAPLSALQAVQFTLQPILC